MLARKWAGRLVVQVYKETSPYSQIRKLHSGDHLSVCFALNRYTIGLTGYSNMSSSTQHGKLKLIKISFNTTD